MKSLDEHNKEARERHRQRNSNEPRKNGIECPSCKAELYDSEPRMVLASNPPQKSVHCDCGFKGYRVL